MHRGAEVLDAVFNFAPDVVLLDIGMPQMSGYEVARRLRERYGSARPALIAVTGFTRTMDRAQARAAGFEHHIGKPYEPRELLQLIGEVAAAPAPRAIKSISTSAPARRIMERQLVGLCRLAAQWRSDASPAQARPAPPPAHRPRLRGELRARSARRPGGGQPVAPGTQRLVYASRSDAGRRAEAPRLVGCARRISGYRATDEPGRDRRARRQPCAARHEAVCRALRRAPIRPLGGPARRRPRHHAGRGHRHRRHAPGTAAERRRPHALLAHRRRPRGAALLAARVRVQRGDVLPRCADDARPEPGGNRRTGDPRHVLRRAPRARARRRRVPRRPVVRALRKFPDPRRQQRNRNTQKAGGLRHQAALPRPGLRGILPGALAAAPRC